MITHRNNQEPSHILPQIRLNKHFRIKSASREKFMLGAETSSVRSRRKDTIQQSKRIFSENRNRKSGSIQSTIKLRITREELQRKFEKEKSKKKIIVYEGVKTEDNGYTQQNKAVHLLRTIHHEENTVTLRKMAKVCDPNGIIIRQKIDDDDNKISGDSGKFKKIKNEKESKQHKGKYRCRVNQFVFDHTRKKSNLTKNQQQNIDQFWKNVNQSLILAGNQQEQPSKDLQQFVQHFVTQ